MKLKIMEAPDDHAQFIQGLTRLLSAVIVQFEPADVFLVRTDNWFDVKWFTFTGNVTIEREPSTVHHAWNTGADTTLPPFVPHRIVEETHYRCEGGRLISAGDGARLLHPTEKKRSAANARNRLLDHSPSALFIWFSSKSRSNGRASVMLYHTEHGAVGGWYSSFIQNQNWRVDRTRNTDRTTVERMFQEPIDDEPTSPTVDGVGR